MLDTSMQCGAAIAVRLDMAHARPRQAACTDHLRAAVRSALRLAHTSIIGGLALLLVAVLFDAQPALAQTDPSTLPPIGATSPLGLGPTAPVGPVGVPLGATQLPSPGISPAPPGSFIPGAMSGSAGCGSSAGLSPTQGMSSATTPFDGGGSSGTASGECPATSGSAMSNPGASGSSPSATGAGTAVGRTGIPLGSSELTPGGLSPLPPATSTTVAPPAPLTAPTTPPAIAAPGMTQASPFAPAQPTMGSMTSCPGVPGNFNPAQTPGTPNFGTNTC